MKNKPLTFFLLLAVASVWGIIFYRVFASLSEEPVTSSFEEKPQHPSVYPIEDSYQLLGNYRDPFLGNNAEKVQDEAGSIRKPQPTLTHYSSTSADRAGGSVSEKEMAARTQLAQLSYMGIIQNAASGQKVCLVSFQGKERILREGETLEGIVLKKATPDSILVSIQNIKLYLKKQ
ncbi:hypothetical protein QNI16_36810 [Cytophagaceae bacterium YF14B1]|uniref:Type II secretion system protein GspC N-terminal domain-containing protein n=1 Tax=Xanthocytophaga flava TaxID=3048013 RepID=A0AAE3QVA3_9BACT|nr:hypothetical protein [Xanthocytophaga flavus]MDJ1486102.1 hypothetical protein [Xanthocytophaga flavus]